MAKTKRKQLAAFAALEVASPEPCGKPSKDHHDHGDRPASNEEPHADSSPPLEVRQQRIIIWIPSSEPTPRLVNSRSFRKSCTPSSKRKRSSDNEEEQSSDTEAGRVYKKYAKIIFKLDNWNFEKDVEKTRDLDDAPHPLKAEKAYKRRKSDTSKEEVVSVLIINKGLPASSSVPANKKALAVKKDQQLPRIPSADDGGNANGSAPGDTKETAREPASQFSRRLGLRSRKILSHGDLVSPNSVPQRLRHEQDETITSREKIFNPTRKVVIASEEEVDNFPEKTQEVVNSASARQKTKLLKDTLRQHEQVPARLHVTAQSGDKWNGQRIASYAESPSCLNRLTSKVRKVKLQKTSTTLEKEDGVVPLHTSVLRTRRRVQTQAKNSASTTLEANSTENLAKLNDCKGTARLKRPSAVGVGNSESSSCAVRVPLSDEPKELHNGSDAVTMSNNAVLISGSRRISFIGRKTGITEGELKRENLGLNVGREKSHMNSMTTSGSGNGNGSYRLGAKFGWSATSLHHVNGANGHVDLIRQGNLKSKSSLHGGSFTTPPGGGVDRLLQKSSVSHPRPSHSNNHADLAAMVRSKVEEVGGLTEWLVGGGLGVFVGLFQDRKIDEGDLLHLTMGSLKEMGVHAVGPRRKLIGMIELLL